MSKTSVDYYEDFMSLPQEARRKVKYSLFYWFQWGNTTIYRKLHGNNLNRAEAFFVRHIIDDARRAQDTQLTIDFDWGKSRPIYG